MNSDIDECLDPTSCPDNATCFNTDGSFECVCDPGFMLNDNDGTCDGVFDTLLKCTVTWFFF